MIKFSEIASLRNEKYSPNAKESLPYIGLEHIEQQTLRLSGVGDSSAVISPKNRFYAGDILFGKLRPYFRKVYRPNFDGVCSADIWVVNAKEGFDQAYIFYLMASKDFINECDSGSSGTRMPRADWKHIANTLWEVPSLEQQELIGSYLSDLDRKIELNRKTNQTLEEIAQAIFKEWFLDFNYPGAAGELIDSPLGPIPKGWQWRKIGDVMTVQGGSTPFTEKDEYWDGSFPWVTPKDLSSNDSHFLYETDRSLSESGVQQISSGILPIGTVLLSSRAPIGYVAVTTVPVSINQGFIAINSDIFHEYYLILWIKNNLNLIKSRANGSTFLEISKSNFRIIDILQPDSETLTQFSTTAKQSFNSMMNNDKQNRILSRIRDSLGTKFFH